MEQAWGVALGESLVDSVLGAWELQQMTLALLCVRLCVLSALQ